MWNVVKLNKIYKYFRNVWISNSTQIWTLRMTVILASLVWSFQRYPHTTSSYVPFSFILVCHQNYICNECLLLTWTVEQSYFLSVESPKRDQLSFLEIDQPKEDFRVRCRISSQLKYSSLHEHIFLLTHTFPSIVLCKCCVCATACWV